MHLGSVIVFHKKKNMEKNKENSEKADLWRIAPSPLPQIPQASIGLNDLLFFAQILLREILHQEILVSPSLQPSFFWWHKKTR